MADLRDPLAPPTPSDLKQPKKRLNVLPCPGAVDVPSMPGTRLRWTDYLHMGARRTFKTALYLGASTGGIAGIAIMAGAPWLLALKGAAIVVASGSLAMGGAKIGEEKIKASGKQPNSEKIAEWIIAIIAAIFKYIKARREVRK